jgi:uncharacterized membrane protein
MSVDVARMQSERTIVLITYVLHLVGAAIGLTSIVALVLNYIRSNQFGEPLSSHHRWMIRTFWWTLVWMVIGWITMFIVVGFAICFLAWVWYVYRHVRGLIALANGEPMPG